MSFEYLGYNPAWLSVFSSVAAKNGDYTKALDVYASYEEQNVMPRARTLRYLAKLLQSHDQAVPFDVPSTAQVGTVTCLAGHLFRRSLACSCLPFYALQKHSLQLFCYLTWAKFAILFF